MADFSNGMVALGALIITVVVAAITATWVLGRDVARKMDLKDCDEALTIRMTRVEHNCGEAVAAIRTKIEQVEFWMRDNLAPKEVVQDNRQTLVRLDHQIANLSELTTKVNTMWQFWMDRARLEATEKGYMKRESPLMLTEKGKEIIAPILPVVKEYCEEHPEMLKMNESELEIELARRFREKILEEMCEPNHIYMGACIVMLIEGLRMEQLLPPFKT